MRNIATTAVVAAVLPFAVQAASVGPYTDLVVFGDSLSDAGNAAIAAPDRVPPAIYPEGQFTNGDVWAVQLGTAPSLAGGLNYGWGGAQAAGGEPTIRFDAQRDAFALADPVLGERPLAAIWFGGNDLRGAIDPSDPLGSVATVPGVIDAATTAIVDGIDDLADEGLTEFLVIGLPNLARLPEIATLDAPGADDVRDFVAGASVGFNTALQAKLAAIDPLADVTYFDTFSFIEGVVARSDALGIDVIAGRCVTDTTFCGVEQGDDFLFYDSVHPSEVVHAQFAQAVREELAPVVPLPAGLWLLGGAFAGLAALRRRP